MSHNNLMPEFHIFYDTETTGAQPRFDQVLQTAAILTDSNFNEIEELDVRSRLATHIVPSAGALKVTHVDPYEIARAPYAPYEYAHMLHNTFKGWSSKGRTSFDGFNILKFDEEIVRQMWWENIHDPYISSSRGNSRNDYLPFLRALFARNPEAIDFPIREDNGKRSFKLEIVAPANGFDDHHAHDALGDVRATIFVAQLIRDVDPALYEHMTLMGSANAVKDFVDTNITFRMLGGAMLNPGALDVCLIASEKANPKSKMAWNLAIDPVPFLNMSPEEILAAMKKPGTPFRSLKCNKTPGVFPQGWEFLNRVSTDDYDPPEAEIIDLRSDIIREEVEFQKNVAEAMRLRVEGYAEPETIEEKIYSGFPSWDDKDRMAAFQRESDWERRLEIVRTFEKPELKQLGLRTVYVNAPEAMPEHLAKRFGEKIAETRHCLRTDLPWNTVGSLMKEVDEMLAEDPNDEEVLNIRKWALETYPVASEWIPEDQREPVDATSSDEAETQKTAPETEEAAPANEDAAQSEAQADAEANSKDLPEVPAALMASTPKVASVHFLDGLD